MSKKAQSSREPTRRQVAHSRKEREQLRLLYMGLGGVGLLILLVLAFGLIQTYVIEPNSPVAVVNGQEVSTRDYRRRVQYERFLLESQYQQILQQLAALPQQEDEQDQFSQMIRNQYQQFASQVLQQRSIVDRQTVDTMIEDRLVAAEAEKRGITVSDDEVTEAINRIVARQEGGLTAAAASETGTAVADASATAALWTPTPTFTPSPTLTTTTEITPTATPADTATPAPTPTLNILTEDTLATQYQNWLITLADGPGIDEATYRDFIRKNLLKEKLAEALGDEVPRLAEQSHARHILVETEDEANAVIERLKAGESFADLAAELSLDTVSGAEGGDLGFVAAGSFVAPVDEAVFTLPIGEISEPIESQFGWHVVEVLEREERELSPSDYSQRQRQAYDDWLAAARAEATIEDLWTSDKAPADSFLDQSS
ncbi:MAG TPA: peptidylprolyl isomerase [Anaerolineae bacterium]|nr:peptidylprolyl isomerase [Anaerolineae bacterium]